MDQRSQPELTQAGRGLGDYPVSPDPMLMATAGVWGDASPGLCQLLQSFLWKGGGSDMNAHSLPELDDRVDIAPWAYCYRADQPAEENPFESRWIVNDDSQTVVHGLAWEEPRRITGISVELVEDWLDFPGRVLCEYWIPSVEWQNSRAWTWYQGGWTPYPVYPERQSPRLFAYADQHITTMKIRFRIGPKTFFVEPGTVPMANVRVFTDAAWKEERLAVEWGFDPKYSGEDLVEEIQAYNGFAERTGLSGPRHGTDIRVLYTQTRKPENNPLLDTNRTVVTLRTTGAKCLRKIRSPEAEMFQRCRSRTTIPMLTGLTGEGLDGRMVILLWLKYTSRETKSQVF